MEQKVNRWGFLLHKVMRVCHIFMFYKGNKRQFKFSGNLYLTLLEGPNMKVLLGVNVTDLAHINLLPYFVFSVQTLKRDKQNVTM